MYKETMEDMRKTMTIVAAYGCLLVLGGCTGDGTFSPVPAEEQPLTVRAQIGGLPAQIPGTRVNADNSYDRSEFIEGDAIRIVRTKGGSSEALIYTLSGGTWGVPAGTNAFRFESAATYRASYPSNYTSIRPDQTTTDSYRLSNLLRTPEVNVSRLGVIDFTNTGGNNNAFVHENVKLTLKFTGSNSGTFTFSSVTVQAPGLCTGGTSMETVYFLRPDASAYTWQAIVYPKNGGTTIAVSFTDTNNVTYKTTLSCEMVAGKDYGYTLTVRNNILMAVGTEIKEWEPESAYVGGFN